MKKSMLRVSAGGIMLCALMCFFFEPMTLLAVLLPVVVHELAHIIVLRIMGLRVRGFRTETRGFCIEYTGYCGAMGHAMAAAAGPAAGFAYAMAASALYSTYSSQWLSLSAGFSIVMSLFNLLPVLPLDGGRIAENILYAFCGEHIAGRIVTVSGIIIGASLLAAGIWIMLDGGGAAVAIAAIWLLLAQDGGRGIVKLREIL